MDPVKHPLDWWALGGYERVMRETGWSRPKARREVRKVIKAYGFRPIGHKGYAELRRHILEDEILDWDLS